MRPFAAALVSVGLLVACGGSSSPQHDVVVEASASSASAPSALKRRLALGAAAPAAAILVPSALMLVERAEHTATLLPDGTVLIAGGASALGGLNTAERYDPVLGTFVATGSMAVVRSGHSATLLPDGSVLIAGGLNASNRTNESAEIYNPASGTFGPTGNLVVARSRHTATRLTDGRVLLAGGAGSTTPYLNAAEIYDPAARTFSATGDMHHRRADGMTATLMGDGTVLILGGNGTDSLFQVPVAVLRSAEVYVPSSGSFGIRPDMTAPRYGHAAARLTNGSVLVAGGANLPVGATGEVPLASAEIYDPAAGSFTATAPMQNRRKLLTATLLSNGQVLLAGGADDDLTGDGSFYTAALELYDPVAGRFSAAGSMAVPRAQHTATLLNNGQVLLAGGDNNGPIRSTELVTAARTNATVSALGGLTDYPSHLANGINSSGRAVGGASGGSSSGGPFFLAEAFNPASVVYLPSPFVFAGEALSINDAGVIAGGGSLDFRNRVYAGGGNWLPHLPGGVNQFGGYINNAGEVVGTTHFDANNQTPGPATLWLPGPTGYSAVDLGLFGGLSIEPLGLAPNLSGPSRIIVGRYPASTFAGYTALWWKNGAWSELAGAPGCSRNATQANDVSDGGIVVGLEESCVPGAALWDNGQFRSLHPECMIAAGGGSGGEARAISVTPGGRVLIVGTCINQPAVWYGDGQGGYIAELLPLLAGDTEGFARGVNPAGQIVGRTTTRGGVSHAALWNFTAPPIGGQTITFTSVAPIAATVGGAPYTVTATGGASGNPVTFSIDATASAVCSIAGSTVSFIGAGTCVINANQAGNSDYTAAPQVQQSFTVSTATPQAPTANNATLAAVEDMVATGTLGATDPRGAALTYSIVTTGTKGTATITNAATGAFSYTPNPNANGPDSFTFKANNGALDSNVATISVTVAAVNDPPVAANGSTTTFAGTAVIGTLVATDVDNTTLIYSVVTNGAKGTAVVTNTATGAYTYTPTVGTSGADSFTFQANDGAANSNLATVNVTIVARAPAANSASLAAVEDTPSSGTLLANDPGGAALTYSIVANGSKGTAAITNAATGAFSYTPSLNANGADSFTFKANNGGLDSNVATISVTIAAVNDPPVAANGSTTTFAGTPVSGTLVATDVDSASLVYSIVANGAKGTAVVTNAATGAYTYTPNAGASGADSFTFRANDGAANSNAATVNVSIVARAPTANSATLAAVEDTVAGGTLVAIDPGGVALTYGIVANGSKGRAAITNAATGAFSYTPNLNANGADSFTFKANNGSADSNVATISVTIAAVNDPPVAIAGTLLAPAGVPRSGVLVASDVDSPTLAFSIVANGTKGTAVVTNSATGAYTYTASAGTSGTDTFTFKANDGAADSNVASVVVTIAPIAPTAVNGALAAVEDTAASATLVAADPAGLPLIYSIVTNGTKGTATITNAATGAFTYTPSLNANGADSFTFKASNGSADSNVATVGVTIAAVNDPPVAANDALSVIAGVPKSGSLVASDVDSPTLAYSIVTNGAKGTAAVTNSSTGAFTYTARVGASGVDRFTFRASDGSANSNVATISVSIAPRVPVALDGTLSLIEDTTGFGRLQATDASGNPLTFSIVTNGRKGTATISDARTGSYQYVPTQDANGPDRFTFKVSNGLADSHVAAVSITISPDGALPRAADSALTTTMNTQIRAEMQATDAAGHKLVFLTVRAATHGLVFRHLSTPGFIYSPDLGFRGQDSFTFSVTESITGQNYGIGTVTITVR